MLAWQHLRPSVWIGNDVWSGWWLAKDSQILYRNYMELPKSTWKKVYLHWFSRNFVFCLFVGLLHIGILLEPTNYLTSSYSATLSWSNGHGRLLTTRNLSVLWFTLWLFNSSPWKDPPFFSSVNHLFRLGPSTNHGELLVITRGYPLVIS